jgi:hypothetical protein
MLGLKDKLAQQIPGLREEIRKLHRELRMPPGGRPTNLPPGMMHGSETLIRRTPWDLDAPTVRF